MEDNKEYRRFLPEQEYVDSFERQGKTVPPFLVMQPYLIRSSVPGYMVPCKSDYPEAERYCSGCEQWKTKAKWGTMDDSVCDGCAWDGLETEAYGESLE